ncbi:MAG: hypothetical protein JSS75_01265 [Bacteroidetes bacterium]|nr:hypothetical protein [Bacteroidota bacterium]
MTIRHATRTFFATATLLAVAAFARADDRFFFKLQQIGGWHHWTYPVSEGPIEIDPVPAGAYKLTIVDSNDNDISARATAHIWIMGFVDHAHNTPFLVGSYELGSRRKATKPTDLGFESKDPLIIWIHSKNFEVAPTQTTPAPQLVEQQKDPLPKHRRRHRK